MSTKCKIRGCCWTGDISALFKHCDKEHPTFVVDICEDTHFNLKFDEIATNTYLLCGKEGLYWFCVNQKLHEKDRIERGIFAIHDSEICQYRILIGSASRGLISSQGPFTTMPLDSGHFDIEWTSRQLMYYHHLQLNSLRIVFSESDQPMDIDQLRDSTLESCERTIYPCKICHRDVDADGSICINQHCLCRNCLGESEEWFGVTTCSICVVECQAEDEEEPVREDSDDGYGSDVMLRAVKLRSAIKIKNMLNRRKEKKIDVLKMALKADRKKAKKTKKQEYEWEMVLTDGALNLKLVM